MEVPSMHFADWIIFACVLLLSSGIGIYHAFTGDKQKTTHDYLSGGNRLGVLPASLSLTVSFISSILVLGYPAEMYSFGSQYWLGPFGWTLGAVLAIYIYLPVLYPLKTTTANEYVGLRFQSGIARVIISIYTIFQAILYAAIVTFGQATAIEAVSGFPVAGIIVIVMVAATFYTTLGGLRGVVWTDVFQTVIMILGLLTVVILGFNLVGGFKEVFRINNEWGRMNTFDFDPDPTKRLNFWGLIIGNALSGASIYGHRQESYQRYAAMPTRSKANWVVMLSMPGCFVLATLSCMVGWAIFAYYTNIGCDPLKSEQISNPNQLVSYFVMAVIQVPGIPGLFLSCVAAGALSTISSVLNGSAAITWSDIIQPHLKVNDSKATLISKGIVVLFGCLIVALAIFVEKLGGNIVQLFGTFSSSTTGPMAGVFLIGMFFPWGNWKGVSAGCILGTAVSLWIGFGSYSIDRHLSKLPTNTANCSLIMGISNSSYNSFETTQIYDSLTTAAEPLLQEEHITGINRLYAISFLWMREIATLVTLVVAVVLSFLTGATDPKTIEPRLLHPWIRGYFFPKTKSDSPPQDAMAGEELKSFMKSNPGDEKPTV